MLGVGLILAILVGFLRMQFLLESPRYFIAKGDYQEATLAASELLDINIKITPETDPQPQENDFNYNTLFSKKYLKNTLFASLPWFLQDIATYGIGIFTPTIIAVLAFTQEDNFFIKSKSIGTRFGYC